MLILGIISIILILTFLRHRNPITTRVNSRKYLDSKQQLRSTISNIKLNNTFWRMIGNYELTPAKNQELILFVVAVQTQLNLILLIFDQFSDDRIAKKLTPIIYAEFYRSVNLSIQVDYTYLECLIGRKILNDEQTGFCDEFMKDLKMYTLHGIEAVLIEDSDDRLLRPADQPDIANLLQPVPTLPTDNALLLHVNTDQPSPP